MIGAIIGDIVGSRFDNGETAEKDFKLFTEDSDFTDKTVCTIAIADAIVNERSYKDALLDWCNRYPEPKGGYDKRFYDWLHSQDHRPLVWQGCEAAVRVSPVGWAFNEYEKTLKEAQKSTIVSNDHVEAVKGSQCVAALIYWLRTTRVSKLQIEKAIKKNFNYEPLPLKDIYKIGEQTHFDNLSEETVPWAIRCFTESNSFEEAIRTAIFAKGNTSAKTSICGAVAESYYFIPEEYIEKAYRYLPDDMLLIIERFYNHLKRRIKY